MAWTCMMYLYYILTQYRALGKITETNFAWRPLLLLQELIKKIADKNNIENVWLLQSAFKWIARRDSFERR